MTPDFLTLYNEELRYLREAGDAFAKQHPQVASQLGIHRNGVQDPFVERLLEGTAFLASRVHERLNNEQAEFALNMLTHLAPNWQTPVPSMMTVALQPDLTHPQWSARTCLPKGSRVMLNDPSLKERPAVFVTGNDVHVQPVEIERAELKVHPPLELPENVRQQFQDSQSYLHLTISTRGITPLCELSFSPLRLTMSCEIVLLNQLLTLLLTNTLRIVLHAHQPEGPIYNILDADAISLAGLTPEESLLPQAIGELPGCRLLREYFAAPGRFSTLLVTGLHDFLARGTHSHTFDLFFLFNKSSFALAESIHARHFHLFATPAINLFPRVCSPVLINQQHTEYPLIVDRLNARHFCIHSLTEVKGILQDGEKRPFSALTGDAHYETFTDAPARWSLRRRSDPRTTQASHQRLPLEQLFLSFSTGSAQLEPQEIKAFAVEALVCERHLRPEHLQRPHVELERSMPIKDVILTLHPSAPQAPPAKIKSWHALQMLNVNPLHYAESEVENCADLLREWLSLFVNEQNPAQTKQLSSIRRATITHHFERWQGAGPLSWTRGTRLSLDIAPQDHADQGAFMFAYMVFHALTDYCELNQRLSFTLTLDGERFMEQGASGG